MDKLNEAGFYYDVAGLDGLRQGAVNNDQQALKQAAQQFESMFMKQLLKQMRDVNAVFESDSPLNSRYTRFYQDMYDQQLALEMSSHGSLGLADLIEQQFSGDAPSASRASGPMPIEKDGKVFALDMQSVERQKTPSSVAVSPAEPPEREQAPEVSQEIDAAKSARFDSPQQFVQQLLPVAREVASAAGLHPLAMVAQAALETGWGKHMITRADGNNSHNLFGIKADRRWQGGVASVPTLEYRDGVAVRERANFRAYSSFADSMRDYADFLKGGQRYQQALKVASEPFKFVEALQQAGYATDPSYASKIQAIMRSDIFRDWLK